MMRTVRTPYGPVRGTLTDGGPGVLLHFSKGDATDHVAVADLLEAFARELRGEAARGVPALEVRDLMVRKDVAP